jgi:hypothetical protein
VQQATRRHVKANRNLDTASLMRCVLDDDSDFSLRDAQFPENASD